jgi:hypothetical protein
MKTLASTTKIFQRLLFLAFLLSLSAAANTIRGSVQNLTRGKPAVGDEVLLLQSKHGMQQEARTTTDRSGAFVFKVVFPDLLHVIRVIHDGVNYDQTLHGSESVQITVYDVVSKIRGINGSLGIVKIESDENTLRVAEMYVIGNTSNPPVTQAGRHSFDLSLPGTAVLDSVQARAPGGIWVNVSPIIERGGKCRLNFPLRPGETLFKLDYHLPNRGPTTLRLRVPYPIRNFGVMHPPSISFRPLDAAAFRSPGRTNGLIVEQAVQQPVMGQVPAFEVSGIGTAVSSVTDVPAPAGNSSALEKSRIRAVALTSSTRPNQPLWIVFGTLLVGVAAGALQWVKTKAMILGKRNPAGRSSMEALKNQLFRLESDRLKGSISGEDYELSRNMLSKSIQHELEKHSGIRS